MLMPLPVPPPPPADAAGGFNPEPGSDPDPDPGSMLPNFSRLSMLPSDLNATLGACLFFLACTPGPWLVSPPLRSGAVTSAPLNPSLADPDSTGRLPKLLEKLVEKLPSPNLFIFSSIEVSFCNARPTFLVSIFARAWAVRVSLCMSSILAVISCEILASCMNMFLWSELSLSITGSPTVFCTSCCCRRTCARSLVSSIIARWWFRLR
mmetsp:Transcript_5019/g.10989  ORF Transcript_5019/g.10989 Transcript_5019/m.10989 type:complete len:208 (-) Transcript_5019:1521-2144(-)